MRFDKVATDDRHSESGTDTSLRNAWVEGSLELTCH